ncbi:MAG: flagellar hook-length control protein FliK [Chromatiaceae bacterium]|nr:flagellar hook-length control protein FliK [Chromatiaceae bacterium]
MGTLQCRIALAGDHVSATFWCERTTTLAHVEQRLPVLRQAFEAQGLDVIRLAGVLGAPPEPLIKVPMPDSLLDERA